MTVEGAAMTSWLWGWREYRRSPLAPQIGTQGLPEALWRQREESHGCDSLIRGPGWARPLTFGELVERLADAVGEVEA